MRREHYQNHVQGMLCRECEDSVCFAVNSQRGVISSKSSFIKNTVDVIYDPEIISSSDIETALTSAGYPVGWKEPKQYVLEFLFFVLLLAVFRGLKSLKYIALPTLESDASLSLIFLIGLLTGAHCISMCGGIALGLSRQKQNENKLDIFKNILPYHIGRLIVCVILGGVFGGLGGVITYSAKAKSMVFTLLGLAMIMMSLNMWGIFPWLRELSKIFPTFSSGGIRQKFLGKSLFVGLFTGIMPCGASYSMWLYASSLGSALKGAVTMGVWCLGTMPLLMGLCIVGKIIPAKYNKWVNLANILLVLMFGISMMKSGIKFFS